MSKALTKKPEVTDIVSRLGEIGLRMDGSPLDADRAGGKVKLDLPMGIFEKIEMRSAEMTFGDQGDLVRLDANLNGVTDVSYRKTSTGDVYETTPHEAIGATETTLVRPNQEPVRQSKPMSWLGAVYRATKMPTVIGLATSVSLSALTALTAASGEAGLLVLGVGALVTGIVDVGAALFASADRFRSPLSIEPYD